jgi:hypothetical protein
MNIKELGCYGVNCIRLFQDKASWGVLSNEHPGYSKDKKFI